jgi:hypothetical protein
VCEANTDMTCASAGNQQQEDRCVLLEGLYVSSNSCSLVGIMNDLCPCCFGQCCVS